jgi:ribosomal protein RSM22 (predicted rRNA methylase)
VRPADALKEGRVELPVALRMALEAEVRGSTAPRLRAAAARMVDDYRAGSPARGDRFLTDEDAILAYAAYRMPATFAAVVAAMRALDRAHPELVPRSLLDVGGGAGAGLWAVASVWPDVSEVTVVDRDVRMLALGARLARASPAPAIRGAVWQLVELTQAPAFDVHDLVLASYVLSEIRGADRALLLDQLWSQSSKGLLIVEPGTPQGFASVRAAREQLIDRGAAVAAPCPHALPCPMGGSDWCHFSIRVARSRRHRLAKNGDLPYEDEKFSYVALTREPGASIGGRVIRHPRLLKRQVQLMLCTPDGLTRQTITKGKQPDAYRTARGLDWGDTLPSDVRLSGEGGG